MTRASDAEVLRSDEAMDVLRSEDDPITSALLNNAHFWFTKKFFEERKRPIADYDYAFFMDVLRAVFSEHAVLRKILSGEKVGQFFEDEDESGLQVELASKEPCEVILRGSLDVGTVPKLQRAFKALGSPHDSWVTLNCHHVTNLDNEWAVALLWVFVQEVQHVGPEIRIVGVDSSCLNHLQLSHRSDAHTAQRSFWRDMFARIVPAPPVHHDKSRK
jgi:ABC-type transporter Mla MlaB component